MLRRLYNVCKGSPKSDQHDEQEQTTVTAFKEQDYYLLFNDFPHIDDELSHESFISIKRWFHNVIHTVNLNFYYNRRSKYEYTNIMRLFIVKLRDLIVFYDETGIYDNNSTFENLKLYQKAMKNYITKMLAIYPTRFPPTTNKETEKNANQKNIDDLLETINNVSLTNEQDMVMKKRVIPLIRLLKRRKKEFTCLFYIMNSIIHTFSLITPSIVTLNNFNGHCRERRYLDYITVFSAIVLSLTTTALITMKVNQKYSMYTRYLLAIHQELWRFLSLTNRYYVTQKINTTHGYNDNDSTDESDGVISPKIYSMTRKSVPTFRVAHDTHTTRNNRDSIGVVSEPFIDETTSVRGEPFIAKSNGKKPQETQQERESVTEHIKLQEMKRQQNVQVLEHFKVFHLFIETIEKYVSEINDMEYEFTLSKDEHTQNNKQIEEYCHV